MALSIALFLNGSRVWFLGAVWVVLIFSWLSFRKAFGVVAFACSSAALFLMFLLNVSSMDGVSLGDSSNRIVATVSVLLTGVDTAHDVGMRDLNFRSLVYQGVLGDLQSGKTREILFGHGTSSGGDALHRIFPAAYNADQLDPNRAIHNEWLRALYEWGVLGLTLMVSVFGTMLVGLLRRYRIPSLRSRAAATLSFLPAFLGALSGENVLAGAGNAVTLSLAIMIALLWAPQPNVSVPRVSL
jgi:hypothetical protein